MFRFRLTGNGRKIIVNDRRLHDHVADNLDKFDITGVKACYLGLTSASAPTFKLDLTETYSSSRCRTARSTRFFVRNNNESLSVTAVSRPL